MPALHKIDDDNRLITTTWTGEATDAGLIDAFLQYHRDVKGKPEYYAYNEIVDFSKTDDFNLSLDGLRKLVNMTSSKDVHGVKTKLAIVVTLPSAYGLARMYEIFRSIRPNTTKELRIFREYSHAVAWIVQNLDIISVM